MKYFFALDTKKKRHIIVANDLNEANKVISGSGLKKECLYELTVDRFDVAGFLISDK